MRKFFLPLAFFLAASAPFCHADVAVPPNSCVITIQSVWLKTVQGDWIKLIEPDKQVDIANYEARVSFFNRDGRIPDGDYTNVKIVLSEYVTVSGRANRSADFNFTKKDGQIRVVGTASQSSGLPGQIKRFEERAPSWTSKVEEMGDVRVHLDLDGGDADDVMEVSASSDFEKPVQVVKGAFISVLVRLDLHDSLRYAWQDDYATGVPSKSVMYFMPQKSPELVRIQAGQRTLDLDQQHVKIVF